MVVKTKLGVSEICDITDYYLTPNISEKILSFSSNREIACRTSAGSYMQRPDFLIYAKDFVGPIRAGTVSFHGSIERWSNPTSLSTGMSRQELDRQRVGWDFMLDIDSDNLVYSKIACNLLFRSLEAHGIKSISIKFSGNTGFHLAVPFEAFPSMVNKMPITAQFPEIPRLLVAYLRTFIQMP